MGERDVRVLDKRVSELLFLLRVPVTLRENSHKEYGIPIAVLDVTDKKDLWYVLEAAFALEFVGICVKELSKSCIVSLTLEGKTSFQYNMFSQETYKRLR